MTITKDPQPYLNAILTVFPPAKQLVNCRPLTLETLAQWESEGKLFCVVSGDGERHYPHFQLQHDGQPFPVIREVLSILRLHMNDWTILAWFRYPNSWILDETAGEPTPICPSAALNRRTALLRAAENWIGTYVA